MATTILPRPPRQEGWGSILGRGIGEGIHALSQGKLQRMNQDYLANRLKQHGQDETLAYLPEMYQKEGYRQSLANTYARQAAEQKAAAELPGYQQQADLLNQGLGTQSFTPEFLATKSGQALAQGLLKGQLKKEAIQEQAASAPLSIGESIAKAFGFTPERTKKQQTFLQKVGSKRKVSAQELFSEKEIQDMRNKGLDPEDVARQLQEESSRVTGSEQSKTKQEEELRRAQIEQGINPQQESATPLQLLSSGLVGGAQGAAAISPAFLPQTLASGALSGINALTNATLGKQFLPSYEDIQNRIPTVKNASDDAIGIMKKYGLIPENAPNESMLQEAPLKPIPTAHQISELFKEKSVGTPLEKYVIPQTKGQQIAENIGEWASLGYKGATNAIGKGKEALKAVAKAVGAETAGWMAENYTGSPLIGRLVSNGTFLASNLFPGTFRKLADEKLDTFEKTIIEPAELTKQKVNMQPEVEKWDKITKRVHQMPKDSTEFETLKKAIEQSESLADNKGMVDPRSLMNTIKIQSEGIQKAPKEAQKLLDEIVKVQEDALNKFGNKINPKTANSFSESNALTSSAVMNEAMRQKIVDAIPMRQLGLGTILYFTGGYPVILATAGAGYLGGTLMNAMKNPAMRSAFGNTLKSAAKGNIAAASKYSTQFDKAFKKSDPRIYNEIEQYRDKVLPEMQKFVR